MSNLKQGFVLSWAILAATVLAPVAQTTWTPANSGTTANLNAVAWNGSLFVAVGASGTLITSPDAAVWTSRISGTTSSLNAVAWTGNRFVAAGAAGTVLTAEDGLAWTPRASGTTGDLRAVAGHAARVVIVGASGRILTSPGGITWDTVPRKMWGHFESVTWSGTRFVAVGGTGTLTSSADGINWSERDSAQSVFGTFYSVAWTGTQFVAAGQLGIWTSPDGATWTRPSGNPNNLYLEEIVLVGDRLFALASLNSGAGPYFLTTSQDGASWTLAGALPDSARFAMIGANGKLVIVGAGGHIMTSTDVVGIGHTPDVIRNLSLRFTTDHLFIELPPSLRASKTRVTIHDMGGKLYRDVAVAGRPASIGTGDLPRGVYVLEVRAGTARAMRRLTLTQ